MRAEGASLDSGLGNTTGYVPSPRTGHINNLGLLWHCVSDGSSTRVVARAPRWSLALPLIATMVALGIYGVVVWAISTSVPIWLVVSLAVVGIVPILLGTVGMFGPLIYATMKARNCEAMLVWEYQSQMIELPRLDRRIERKSIVRFEWVWVRYERREWIEPQAVLCVRSEDGGLEWIALEPNTSSGLKTAIKKFARAIEVPFERVKMVSDETGR